MFLLLFAALCGGILTAAIVAPFGPVLCVLSAPLGGSFCAILAAVHLSRRHDVDTQIRKNLEEQTNSMVAALTSVALKVERGSELEKANGDVHQADEGMKVA